MDEVTKPAVPNAVDILDAAGFTEREIREVNFCLMYTGMFNHGSDGHNRMNLVSKLVELVIKQNEELKAK